MTTGNGIAVAAFWLFVSMVVYTDAQVFMSGRDGYVLKHDTTRERALQRAEVKLLQRKTEK
jgi:hypothetical protein